MPLSYQQIISDSADVTFEYQGEPITFSYCPGKITDKVYSQLMHLVKSETTEESLSALNDFLVSLLLKWDIYEDEKQTKMFPIEAERLVDLPVPLKFTVLIEIGGDFRPEGGKPQTTK